jgi:hypothetical protein
VGTKGDKRLLLRRLNSNSGPPYQRSAQQGRAGNYADQSVMDSVMDALGRHAWGLMGPRNTKFSHYGKK